MLKDMVKGEVLSKQDEEGEDKKLKFSSTMAKICLKHFEVSLAGRGVFILLELIENPATTKLVAKQLKAQ